MEHGQIAEYGQVKHEDFSKVEVLDTKINGRREYRFSHHSAGWECAGSMVRFNAHEVWSVLFEADGATHGRRFLKESEARELFNKWGAQVN